MKARPEQFKKVVFSHLSSLEKRRLAFLADPGEVENVHQMRVSTRRLREALVFLKEAVDQEKARGLIREMRVLGRSLGNCRAYDVSMGLLKKEFGKTHRVTVDFVVERLSRSRKTEESRLLKVVHRHKGTRFEVSIEEMLEKAGKRFEGRWKRAIAKILGKRSDRIVRDLKKKNLSRKEGIHDLRIGIKKFRYDLEIAGAMGDLSKKKQIAVLKRYQAHLGRWHDYEVLTHHLKEILSGFEAGEKERWGPRTAFLLVGAMEKEHAAEQFILRKLRKENSDLRRTL